MGRCGMFARDGGGNVIITFALLLIPITLAMGFAVDYTRVISSRAQLQAVLDAALLAEAHKAEGVSAEALTASIAATVLGGVDEVITIGRDGFRVVNENSVITADVSARISTTLMSIAGIPTMDFKTHAQVVAANEPVEIALSLDVTGSMAGDMPKLREGAQAFVDIVMAGGQNSRVRIALVPFVGAVNIGNSIGKEAWLDKDGSSLHAAQTIRGKWLAADNRPQCNYETTGNGGGDGGPNPDSQGLLPQVLETTKWALGELVGITTATAQVYTYTKVLNCYYANPEVISNWRLFNNLSGVSWKGCVEARPMPYDIDDTPPGGDPNTRWVPYFWLDGLDEEVYNPSDRQNYRAGKNNYISDGPILPGTDMATSDWGRSFSALKYRGQTVPLNDETPPATYGPNRSCPDPILPLTSDYAALTSRISGLMHYYDGGTNTPEGVAWGLRVLSPGMPFDEGAAYGAAKKILVLFSDGGNGIGNDVGGNDKSSDPKNSSFLTEYMSYGFARYGRLPKEEAWSSVNGEFLDQRLEAACRNVKATGIEIYVVAFGVNGGGLRQLERCATSLEHVVSVSRGSDLKVAFRKSAREISPLRLTR